MRTGQGAVAVLSDWEGNRRSGVALSMRISTCRLSVSGKGEEIPAWAWIVLSEGENWDDLQTTVKARECLILTDQFSGTGTAIVQCLCVWKLT